MGGHCIPKDPWLLAYGVKDRDVALRIIPAARAVNDSMPVHMIELLKDALAEAGRELKGARVAVLGYAYLEESDDTRNSPSETLVRHLREMGVEAVIHDPWVDEYRGEVLERVKGCDAAIVMVAHNAYRGLDLQTIKSALRLPVLVDGRRVFDVKLADKAGFVYRGVGVAAR